MKIRVTTDQQGFFRRHKMIEFQGLLEPEPLNQFNAEIGKALDNRSTGHDLWRTNEILGKLIRQSKLARIAADLIEVRPLRLGYDQLFLYMTYTKKHQSLNDFSCLQGIVCGLMLCLKGTESPKREESVFSTVAGNGVYFNPHHEINMDEISQMVGARYLLIVYTHASTVYILNKDDPHLYDFKKLGYNYGDKLLDHLNPIVCR